MTEQSNEQVIGNINEDDQEHDDMNQEDKAFNVHEFEKELLGDKYDQIMSKVNAIRAQKDKRDTVNTETKLLKTELKQLGMTNKMTDVIVKLMDMEPEQVQKIFVAFKMFAKATDMPMQLTFLDNVIDHPANK